jgi:hypothetical protein
MERLVDFARPSECDGSRSGGEKIQQTAKLAFLAAAANAQLEQGAVVPFTRPEIARTRSRSPANVASD